MDETVQRKVLSLLGLGARGRNVVSGVDLVKAGVQRGRVALVVIASDVSKHSRDKLVPLLQAKRIEFIECSDGTSLAAAVGKSGVTAAVGVTDAALAKGIRAAASAALKAV